MTDDNGLYYMRARFYNPEIRRFVNQDVLLGFVANGQTLNRYAYVKGRAISSIDPFGLEDVTGSYSEDLLKNYDNTPPLAPIPEMVGILIIAFTPGGGELLDIDALFGMSSPSSGWEKFGAGSSLVLSVLTLGTSPNLGSLSQFAKCDVNPSARMDNCIACVSADIANRLEVYGKNVTADEIERLIAGVSRERSIQLEEALSIIEKATQTTARKQPMLAPNAPVGYYAIFMGHDTIKLNHVIMGVVLPNGQKIFYDPQNGKIYDPAIHWPGLAVPYGGKAITYLLEP
jgi:RHS repeat-associated protein